MLRWVLKFRELKKKKCIDTRFLEVLHEPVAVGPPEFPERHESTASNVYGSNRARN
jgi:hypothetical protein